MPRRIGSSISSGSDAQPIIRAGRRKSAAPLNFTLGHRLDHITSPTQIRNAFLLLWASFAISLIDSVFTLFVPGFSEEELGFFRWLMFPLFFVGFAASAYVIYCASRRKKWARVVLLLLTMFAGVLLFAWPSDWDNEACWSTLVTTGCLIMDTVAVIWLFSGEGAKWFSAQRP